jgi:hypothetical protein
MSPSYVPRIDGIVYIFFVPVIFIVMCGVFVLIMVGSMCEVYRVYRKHKKRQEEEEEEADASIMWHHSGQPAKYQEPLVNSNIKMTAYKNVSWDRMINTMPLSPSLINFFLKM